MESLCTSVQYLGENVPVILFVAAFCKARVLRLLFTLGAEQ